MIALLQVRRVLLERSMRMQSGAQVILFGLSGHRLASGTTLPASEFISWIQLCCKVNDKLRPARRFFLVRVVNDSRGTQLAAGAVAQDWRSNSPMVENSEWLLCGLSELIPIQHFIALNPLVARCFFLHSGNQWTRQTSPETSKSHVENEACGQKGGLRRYQGEASQTLSFLMILD